MRFNEFNFEPVLMEGIETMGFETATPVQEKSIPPILEGKDVMALAQTGTGKTAAFLLPVVNRIISTNRTGKTRALIVVPTRELAMQIDQQMEGLSYFTPVSSIAIYGGSDGDSFVQEQTALKTGAEMIVCTPGRMIAHLNQGYFDFSELDFLVLDEADRMLDMGFYNDIMRIVKHLPEKRQNLFFAATMIDNVKKLAHEVLKDPVEINIAISKPAEKILQAAYVVYENQKLDLARHILSDNDLGSAIVFCSTKKGAKDLNRELKRNKIDSEEIHSDLEQADRTKILTRFKNRSLKILVATDVISRGIDVENIELIVNYDVPENGESYIHRIGRTARAEADGVALTIIGPKEQSKFDAIEKVLGKEVFKSPLPEGFSEGPSYTPHKRGPKPKKGGYYKKKRK